MKLKFIIPVLAFLLFSNLSYSQVISLAELIKLAHMNEDDGDTFMTSKGYSYSKSENTERVKMRTYAFDKTGKAAAYWLSQASRFYNYNHFAKWTTSKTDQYLNIKKQLKLAGFVFSHTDTDDKENSTTFIYKKGKIMVEIYVREKTAISGNIINSYEIAVLV